MEPTCVTLPSADAALSLVRGNYQRGIPSVVGSTIVRSMLIAGGLYIAGDRKRLAAKSICAALAIEAFVVSWITYREVYGVKPAAGAPV